MAQAHAEDMVAQPSSGASSGDDAPATGAVAAGAGEDAPGAFPSQYDDSGMSSFDKVEADLRGAALRILAHMPDGKVHAIDCNMGHDVTFAKAKLSQATDIAYGRIKFFLEDKLMFDPLSFNDFPSIVGLATKEIQVRVEVAPDPNAGHAAE